MLCPYYQPCREISPSAIWRDQETKKGDNDDLDDDTQNLQELADGLEEEESITLEEKGDDDDDEIADDDDEEGWVDELDELDEEERKELLKSIRPVSRMLVKVFK
jgi:hypothetical protein